METYQGKAVWIDIVSPTESDIALLGKRPEKFHPVILEELTRPSARPKTEYYKRYGFFTYHLPVYDETLKTSRRAEIDFLITPSTVITVRYDKLEPIDELIKRLQENEIFRTRVLESPTAITYRLIETITDFSLRQLKHIEDHIQAISLDIFGGRERELLQRISIVKRDVLDYRRISEPQQIILTSLRRIGEQVWNGDAAIYLDDLIGDNLKVQQQLATQLDVIESLEATNGQLLDAKTSYAVEHFSALAFFTFPLMVFIGIFTVPERTSFFWFGFIAVLIITVVTILSVLRGERKTKS